MNKSLLLHCRSVLVLLAPCLRRRATPKFFLVLTALVSLGTSQVWAETIQWKTKDGGNGHFYEVVSVPGGISWDDANAAATAAGGYLATITSQAENNFVFSLINSSTYWTYFHSTYEGPWLGGYQYPATTTPTANWNWVTGESWGYTNWAAGQPNDNGGSEDKLNYYGVTGRTSGWNDIRSIDPLGKPVAYVVEFVPEPSSLILLSIATASLLAYAWRRRLPG